MALPVEIWRSAIWGERDRGRVVLEPILLGTIAERLSLDQKMFHGNCTVGRFEIIDLRNAFSGVYLSGNAPQRRSNKPPGLRRHPPTNQQPVCFCFARLTEEETRRPRCPTRRGNVLKEMFGDRVLDILQIKKTWGRQPIPSTRDPLAHPGRAKSAGAPGCRSLP